MSHYASGMLCRAIRDRLLVFSQKAQVLIRNYHSPTSKSRSEWSDKAEEYLETIREGAPSSVGDFIAWFASQEEWSESAPAFVKPFLRAISSSTPVSGWLPPLPSLLSALDEFASSGDAECQLTVAAETWLDRFAPSIISVWKSEQYRDEKNADLRQHFHAVLKDAALLVRKGSLLEGEELG